MSVHKKALNQDTESGATRFRGCAESSRTPEAQAAAVPGGAGVLEVFLGGETQGPGAPAQSGAWAGPGLVSGAGRKEPAACGVRGGTGRAAEGRHAEAGPCVRAGVSWSCCCCCC